MIDLLRLDGAGNQLAIGGQLRPAAADGPLVDLQFDFTGHPFSGTYREAYIMDDLVFWSGNLRRLTLPGEVVLGGERLPDLALGVQPQAGGNGSIVVHVSFETSDQAARLDYVIYGQVPFWIEAAVAVEALIERGSR